MMMMEKVRLASKEIIGKLLFSLEEVNEYSDVNVFINDESISNYKDLSWADDLRVGDMVVAKTIEGYVVIQSWLIVPHEEMVDFWRLDDHLKGQGKKTLIDGYSRKQKRIRVEFFENVHLEDLANVLIILEVDGSKMIDVEMVQRNVAIFTMKTNKDNLAQIIYRSNADIVGKISNVINVWEKRD